MIVTDTFQGADQGFQEVVAVRVAAEKLHPLRPSETVARKDPTRCRLVDPPVDLRRLRRRCGAMGYSFAQLMIGSIY